MDPAQQRHRPRSQSAPLALAAAGLLIGMLASSCASQQSKQAPAPATASKGSTGEAIAIKFNWPDGLRARVRSTSVKAQALGPQSRTQDLTADYIMTAAHNERGLSVSFEDFRVVSADAPADSAVGGLLAYRPGFLVDNSGQLLEVQGLETLRAMLDPLQQEIANATQEERASLQAVAQTVTSEQYLKARAGAEWSNLIGTWLNETFEIGRVVKVQGESAATGALDTPVTTEIRTSVARIGTCNRKGATGCVRLQLTKEPDAEKLRRAMIPNLNKMLGVDDWGPAGPPELKNVVATSQLIVDTEPDTLIPHRVEALRVLSLELMRPEGPLEVRDSNRSTSTYTYD